VRLLNSLDDGEASVKAIEEILRELHAVPEIRHVTAGASGFRTAYRLPDGRRVYFKQIGRTRLPVTCASCRFNNDRDCQEGYYGIRLYRAADGRYMVGVCIQRMDLCRPVEEFVGSPLCAEIVELREHEYRRATRQAG
jgi:cyclic pyranopterin phosphate synthase